MRMSNVPVVVGLKASSFCADDAVVLEVFVASRTKDGDECGAYAAWVKNISVVLCELAGGCTQTAGIGSWVNPDTRELVCEHTTTLRSFASRGRLLADLGKLRQVLVQYGRECEQHTVAFALDGEFFGIDPGLPY